MDSPDGLEPAEHFSQAAGANGHRVLGCPVVAAAREWRNARLALQPAQQRDEGVLEGGRRPAHIPHGEPRACQRFAHRALARWDVTYQYVETVAEALDVDDPVALRQRRLRPAQVGRVHLEALQPEALTQLGRRADLMQPSFVHKGDAMTALRLVEVRGRQQDRDALA